MLAERVGCGARSAAARRQGPPRRARTARRDPRNPVYAEAHLRVRGARGARSTGSSRRWGAMIRIGHGADRRGARCRRGRPVPGHRRECRGGGLARAARRRFRRPLRARARARRARARRGRGAARRAARGRDRARRSCRRVRRRHGRRPRRLRRGAAEARLRLDRGADQPARPGRFLGRRQDRGQCAPGQESDRRLPSAGAGADRPGDARHLARARSCAPAMPRWSNTA